MKSEQSHNLPSSWNPSHPSPFNPELRIPPFPIQDPGFQEAPHSLPFCRVLALLWGEGALELLLSTAHYPQPSSFPWILVPERWSHSGQEGVSDPQINTSVWEAESRVVSVCAGGQRAGCALQPALASADESRPCLVVAHSLISGCNRIQGQMLKAPGPREDRCPGSKPSHTEGLACTCTTHIQMHTPKSPGNAESESPVP